MTKKEIQKLVRNTYWDNKNNPKKQIKELKKLLKHAKELGDIYYIGHVFYSLATAYNVIGDRERSFLYAIRSLTVFKNTEHYEMLADAYIALGAAYFNQENYQLSLANYDKAYEIIRRHRIKGISRSSVINNLATLYNVMGDYKTGIKYLTECMNMSKRQPDYDQALLLVNYINLADSYMHMKDYKKSEELHKEAESLTKIVKIKPYVCFYYTKFAETYYNLKNQRLGSKYIDKAFEYVENSYAYFVFESFRELAHILMNSSDKKRAEKMVGLIKEYGKRNDETMDKLLVSSTFAEYYKLSGEFKLAAEYYEQVEALYQTRTKELKQIQISINKSLKDADSLVNKLNKLVAKSEDRADRDPMTGLLNRAAMLRVGDEFIKTAVKDKEKIGAIFIDIDFFKECNDTYGHAKGDEIIKKVAGACRVEESAKIRFARYGGDEFLGLTRGLSDDAISDIARSICRKLHKADIPNKKNPKGGRVTLSVGIANVTATEKTDTIIQIANYADKAVYYSKNAGKDCIHLLNYDCGDDSEEDEQFVKIDF
ncbi:MAG: GGDEF domain-containing protein [Lachnospiraceae bacterium]|nr:GGDEF domain-containing protein [Lachnospiraceae bacterium]